VDADVLLATPVLSGSVLRHFVTVLKEQHLDVLGVRPTSPEPGTHIYEINVTIINNSGNLTYAPGAWIGSVTQTLQQRDQVTENQQTSLETHLEELRHLLLELQDSDEATGREIDRRVRSATEEAMAPSPDRSLIDRYIELAQQTAKDLGDRGASIIKVVARISEVLRLIMACA